MNQEFTLSGRAANCLSRAGITTKEQARHVIVNDMSALLVMRGCGKKTFKEICEWADASPPCTLSTRAFNCLQKRGITTKEQARKEILEGRLKPGDRGYGPKSHESVCEWAWLGEQTAQKQNN